jgi:hypothetical protein
MSQPRSLDSLSRQELFELVWKMPVTKIAADYGVTDPAIHKRCKKLQVPTPPRGYWAKKQFGKAPKKPELPPSQEEIFAKEAAKPVPASLNLPQEGEGLRPLAAEFLAALMSSSLSYDKQRVHLEKGEFPKSEISKAQAARAAGVFHWLLELLEPRGIPFRKSQGYSGGHFRKSHDRLYLRIVEELVDKPEDTKRRRGYYSTWQTENKVPCGRLTFTLNPENWGAQKEKRWVESEKLSLETITSELVKAVSKHFADLQRERQEEAVRQEKARIEWEIKRKKEMEEEAIRQQTEAKRKHAETLEQTARTRQEDLLKAAEWWRLYRGTEDFIAECERRWREAQQGNLQEHQSAWLTWAREVSEGISPFESGYPDPARDGVFDAAAVPFGGPYPEQRKFPQPPTMPSIPAPVVVQQSYGQSSYHPEPKPYPFWLRYQRR